MKDDQLGSSFVEPAAPPLTARVSLALAQLRWPDAVIHAAIETLARCVPTEHSAWFVRALGMGNPGMDGVESGALELWSTGGAWLQVSAEGTTHGSLHHPRQALETTETAHLGARAQALPSWLQEQTPTAIVRAPHLAMVHYDLPGDSARECMQAANAVMRGGLDSPAAAALSTCPADRVGIEFRSDRSVRLVVRSPPPRVTAWILGDGVSDTMEQVAFLLATRGIHAIYVDSAGNASVSWRLA